jgi:ribosomal protein S18 acetylase RimI-like enzyme
MTERTNKEQLKFNGTIRPLAIRDLSFLRSILNCWIKDRDTGELLTDEVSKTLMEMGKSVIKDTGRTYLIAEEGGEILGVMGLKQPDLVMGTFAASESPIELVNAYVRPDVRRGRGVGTALVDGLESAARKLGKKEILLNSGPRYSETGWGFYDRLGFDRVGVIVEYYGEGGNAQVWRKTI